MHISASSPTLYVMETIATTIGLSVIIFISAFTLGYFTGRWVKTMEELPLRQSPRRFRRRERLTSHSAPSDSNVGHVSNNERFDHIADIADFNNHRV